LVLIFTDIIMFILSRYLPGSKTPTSKFS